MSVREYTALALVAAGSIVALELLWLRTGLFRRRAYWCALATVFAVLVPVDGWLTKLSAPIIVYAFDEFSGWRFPFDIPLEDFVAAFAVVTLTLLLWERSGDVSGPGPRRSAPVPPA